MVVGAVATYYLVSWAGSAGPGPAGPTLTKYHTFTILNDTDTGLQLTKLEVTPIDGGPTLTADFVVNGHEERNVQIPIPKTGIYRIAIYSPDDKSMWWDNVALELPGHTRIRVYEGYDYGGECAEKSSSGQTMHSPNWIVDHPQSS
jgi:hypothetical protein